MYRSSMTWGEANKGKKQTKENSQRQTTHRSTNKPNQTTNRPRKQNETKPPKRESHKHQQGQRTPQRANQNKQKTRAQGEDGKRRPASKERAEARGRRQHKPRRRARAALAVSEGDCGSPEGEYLSAGARGTWTPPTNWCRGQSPTQGRSLCCQEAEWRQEPLSHDTPCQRYDNRTVANTTRYPEGGTSRKLTGPENTSDTKGGRGGGETRRNRATPQAPKPPGHKEDDNHTKSTEQQQRKGGAPQHQETKTHEKRKGKGQQGTKKVPVEVRSHTHHPKHSTTQLEGMSLSAQSADRHTHTQCLKLEKVVTVQKL